MRSYQCPTCHGTGRIHDHECDGRDERVYCRGWGTVELDAETAIAMGLLTEWAESVAVLYEEGQSYEGAVQTVEAYGLRRPSRRVA